jgi:autotransporter-associated beta strand protein
LTLTLNGGPNLVDSAVTIVEVSPTTYEIGGLQSLTATPGSYALSVSATGLVDAAGNSGVGGLSESWTLNTTGPTVASIGPAVNNGLTVQSPRNIVVPTLDVTFSEPIDPSSFTYQAIDFSKDGGPNLIVPGITIQQLSPTEFEVGNFENLIAPVDGDYTFTVGAAGVSDLAGNSGTGSSSVSWDLVTTGPAAPANLAISPNTGISSSGVANTNAAGVVFTGLLSEPGLAVEVSENGTALGYATVTGAAFSEDLTLQAGTNDLAVYAVDAAGNVSPITDLTAFYDAAALADTVPPTSSVSPLPAVSNSTRFTVQWSGQDNPGGSGIATFDVYVQDNGGPFTLWQSQTAGTSAVFTGVAGDTYGFYSVATDQAGNRESKAASAESSTLVQIATTTSVSSNYPSGSVYGQTILLTATVTPIDAAAGPPSGAVQFQIDGADVGGAIALSNGTASIVVPGLNAANYPITASYDSDTIGFLDSSRSLLQKVTPAPVVIALQSGLDWSLAGQELSVVAVASTTATSNGQPLDPDGAVTFYDNGATLASQSLATVAGQDQAVLDLTALAPGEHVITASYTSTGGNFAASSASPVLIEMIYPSDTIDLTVVNTSSDPTVAGSLPWAVAQADESSVATVITFASGSGQVFATPQTITLEASLDLSGANLVGIEGPSSGVTLVGDYSQLRFPVLIVAQDAAISIRGVDIGTRSPGANGDIQVAGVLDVIETVANLGSAVNVRGGGTLGLDGQTVTADTLTLTDGTLTAGTLTSGSRTVLSGTVSSNLAGSGGLVKDSTATVVLSGTNTFSGGVQVLAGTLVIAAADALPDGSGLTIGADASSIFGASQAAPSLSSAAFAVPAPETAVASETSAPVVPAGSLADAPVTASVLSTRPPRLSVTSGRSAETVVDRASPAITNQSTAGRNGPAPIVPPAAFQRPRSVPAGALDASVVDRLAWLATVKRIAGNLAWLGQTASSSDKSDQNHQNDAAILVLDAVFADYGR